MNELHFIQPGLTTAEFQVCLSEEEVREFAKAIEWPLDRGVPPTLPVTFWRHSYPAWLASCKLPQLLKRQSFTYLKPLQTNVNYTCRITCQQIKYVQTRNGKHYLAAHHRLLGELDQTLHVYADTLLYLPVPAQAESELIMKTDEWPTSPEAGAAGWSLLSSQHKKITPYSIGEYAKASGDTQPIHLDEQAAQQAGFPNILAHGMYGMGLGASALAPLMLPTAYIHTYRMEFLSPLFAGDSLTVSLYSQGTSDFHIAGAKEPEKDVFRANLTVR